MLISVSVAKPMKIDLQVLQAVFGNDLNRSQHALIAAKYPVIPKFKQTPNGERGTALEVSYNYVTSNTNVDLYVGFIYSKAHGRWNSTPSAFCVKNGKVFDVARTNPVWSAHEQVIYTGIKVPDEYYGNGKYKQLWYDKQFISYYSPLSMIDVIPKGKNK